MSSNDQHLLTTEIYGDALLDSLTLPEREPWREVFQLATATYYGYDDVLQDYSEALELYKKAAKLGYPYAYWRLGIMYREGEGCTLEIGERYEH